MTEKDLKIDNNTDLGHKLITAENHLNQSDFESSYNIYSKLITEYNNSPEIYNNLAISAYQLEKHQESIEYIKIAIKLSPNNPLYLIQHAQFLFSTDFKEADKLFNQALKIVEDIKQPEIANQIKHNYSVLLFNQACVLATSPEKQQQEQAIALFSQSIEHDNKNYKSYFNLACCYINIDSFDNAIKSLIKTIEINPNHSQAHFALSQYYQQTNNTTLAENHLKKSLESDHINQAHAEYNYGVLEQQRGNYNKAIEHYNNCLTINPDHFAACYNTASIHQKIKNITKAIEYYSKAIKINPEDNSCKYLIASLLSENTNESENNLGNKNNKEQKLLQTPFVPPDQAPVEYIENLFDSYADNFDNELTNNLQYKTPEHLYNLFIHNLNTTNNNLNILDLGCGTGLSGKLFTKHSSHLTGVDLSQNMLNIASKKNIYNTLIKSDINNYLSHKNHKKQHSKYDLIILADVLVYYGKLDVLFNKIKQNMNNNGYLLFSTELLDTDLTQQKIYKLNQNGRYSHSDLYIKQLVNSNNLHIIANDTAKIRYQDNQPVIGMVYLISINL